jgi:O-antigen ligase
MIKTIPFPEQWNNRIPLYASSLAMFKDHPIKGTGLGMFEQLIKTDKYILPKDYPLMDTIYKDIYLHAHNVYFEILAEMGLLGLAAFFYIFIVFFRNVYFKARNIRDQDCFASFLGVTGTVVAALVYAISATIITVGVNEPLFYWLLFGLGIGLLKKGDLDGGYSREFSR